MDPETRAKITRLERFKDDLYGWRRADDQDHKKDEHRTNINRNKKAVRKLVIDAGCHQKVIARMPPGRQHGDVYVDPFDLLFDSPDSEQAITWVIDMVDETIGVLQDKAAALQEFMENGTATEPPFIDVRLQQGRLELVDPSPESPLKLNRLAVDLPDELAAVTRALRDLIMAVNADNSALGETIKRQLIAMLEVALQDLNAPYADVGRLARTRDFIKTVGVAAVTGAATATLTTQFDKAATALGNAIGWLIKQAS